MFRSQVEEVLVRFDEIGNNFCMVLESVDDLDRLTLQVEVRGLADLTRAARTRLAKKVAAAVKATIGVTPRVELAAPFSLPRMTGGQGKTACHRVDERRRP